MTRILIGLSIAVSFLLATAAADAAERSRKKWVQNKPSAERIYSQPDANGWYPRDSNQLKFGSRIWWEQMEREGRTGQRPW